MAAWASLPAALVVKAKAGGFVGLGGVGGGGGGSVGVKVGDGGGVGVDVGTVVGGRRVFVDVECRGWTTRRRWRRRRDLGGNFKLINQ